MKTYKVKIDCSLKDFTDSVFPQGAFCFNTLLKNKDIKVNGLRVRKNVTLFIGDEVIYYTTAAQESVLTHYTVFENEKVLIADKLSGVSSEGLLSELCECGNYYAVHRLDRNTQGLMAFAKTEEAYIELSKAFKERSVEKTYLAVCKNALTQDKATLCGYLLKDEKNAKVKIFEKQVKGSVRIITEYEAVEKRDDLVLVKIILHTGKTHQIRAHRAYIGCPVLGDEKYGDEALNKKYSLKRQCLVAKRLKFLPSVNCGIGGKIFESRFSPTENLK